MHVEEISGSSKSLNRLRSRLTLTLDHTKVVNKALVETASHKTKAGKSSEHRSIANHAMKRNAELAIQLLYPHFTEYLRSLLREMYDVHPFEIVSKAQGMNKAESSIRFDEIVRLGSYEAICEHIVDRVFRSLENQRNTTKLLDKILDNTGVEVDQQVLRDAMMYLDMRHLIVHNTSLVDEVFEQRYGSLLNKKAGDKLGIDVGVAKRAVKTVKDLCVQVDRGLIYKGLIHAA